MPKQVLAPIFDQINLFLLNLVRKEVDFSSETFETFTRDLSQFLASMGRNLLELFLDLNQPSDNQLEHKGRKYFYKKTEDKKYATLFGKITVSRRVYFNSGPQKSLISLEKSLHMEIQFATVEARELMGYLSGFLTPKTIWNVLSRFWNCSLSQSSIQRIGDAVGKARNPSKALALASFALPPATFYAATSFMLGKPMLVFVSVVSAYFFATLAMLIPAIDEFDVATGRATAD